MQASSAERRRIAKPTFPGHRRGLHRLPASGFGRRGDLKSSSAIPIALFILAPFSAYAGPEACLVDLNDATAYVCSGDQSDGIDVGGGGANPPAGIETLTVNSLTTDLGEFVWKDAGSGNRTLSFDMDTYSSAGVSFENTNNTVSGGTATLNFVGRDIATSEDYALVHSSAGASDTSNPGLDLDVTLGAAPGAGPLTITNPGGGGVLVDSFGGSGENGTAGDITTTLTSDLDLEFGELALSSAGTGRAGGNVSLLGQNHVLTLRDGQAPVFLQSIGGTGDFNGAAGRGGDITLKEIEIRTATTFDNRHGIQASSWGGAGSPDSGAGGGLGGEVALSGKFDVQTLGNDSDGVVATSLGGAGADGSEGAGSGGNSDPVGVLSNGGFVFTLGDKAVGIGAQSIGGRGANVTTSRNVGLVAFGADGGASGKSDTVTNAGDVTTRGFQSQGLLGQSIGGGGGSGGSAFGLFYGKGGSGGVRRRWR